MSVLFVRGHTTLNQPAIDIATNTMISSQVDSSFFLSLLFLSATSTPRSGDIILMRSRKLRAWVCVKKPGRQNIASENITDI